ncbi:MAG: hypothetical protein GWP14_01160 [Actinobacteria bacterium]|nr:hypothetical protein [Actinomycetota bacterium]
MAKKRRRRAWAKLPLEQLLDVRLCELDVQIKKSVVEQRIDQVLAELDRRGIVFKPHFWVSDDWFTPAGVSGCAVPFYLLHPRLSHLERKQMLEVEGAERSECIKILRHEAGHAIEHAYRLNLRKKRQRLFGKSTKPYPDAYLPQPFSRRFVQNIDYWYAQSHPDEDFAETFAVWLGPRSNWRKIYQGWPAMKKLLYMDELMNEIAGTKPPNRSRRHVSPLKENTTTLRQYYAKKQKRYATEYPNFYDADLLRLFSAAPEHKKNETAASFLRRVRPSIRNMVSQWTGHYAYSLDQVLKDIIGRCRELKLRVGTQEKQLKMDATIMLTVNTMNFLYSGQRWVDL